ncbi:hypothetical protein LSAT2_012127 [Lamellibrachia satsuma]|nr:hypothetical protein LSAT2_012127 [Lamellibrachia satsuma]
MVTSMRTVLLLTSMLLAVVPRAQGGTFIPCLRACRKARYDCNERCDAIGMCEQSQLQHREARASLLGQSLLVWGEARVRRQCCEDTVIPGSRTSNASLLEGARDLPLHISVEVGPVESCSQFVVTFR